MNDPQRLLLDGGATDLEKEILASWQRAKSLSAARERTLAMVGLATGAAVMTATTTAAGSSIAPKAAGVGAVVIAKWLAIGGVALGTTAAAIGYAGHEAREPTEAPALGIPSLPARPAESAARAETRELVATAAPVAPVERAASAPVRSAPEPHAAASTLNEQVSLLDRARAALARGDDARSRESIDEYETRFPEGAFTQEADVLRIQALLQEGHKDAARHACTRFLEAYPTSPHAARVRALLGDAS